MNRSLFLILVIALAACGRSHAATHRYGVTSFDRIQVTGPFDVHVHVGGSGAVTASGPQDAIDRLSVEQQGNRLVLKPLPGGWGGWPTGNHGKLSIDIVAPSLVQAAVTGSGETRIEATRGDTLELFVSGSGSLSVSGIDVTQLTATMTGSGTLSVAGRARTAKTIVSGSGDILGGDLATDDADVGLIGSGDLKLGVKHDAKVKLVGSGDVTIIGPAACVITQTGSGEVRCDHRSGE